MKRYETIATDVLVVGSGLAGLIASIEASMFNIKVCLVTKRTLGSGNSLISYGGFSAPFGEMDDPDTYFQDTIQGGYFLNEQRLVKLLATKSCASILRLIEIGVPFEGGKDKFTLYPAGGHSVPRGVYCLTRNGKAVVSPLKKRLLERKIATYENQMVVRVFTSNKEAEGVMTYDTRSGKFTYFQTKAIVLATGGAGTIYKRTTNASGSTGDGYFLASQAGAPLIDMEFVQFYPEMSIHPFKKILVNPEIYSYGGQLLNSQGERFMKRYSPVIELATRDIRSRAIYAEVISGRGNEGGVMLNLANVERKIVKKTNPNLYFAYQKRGWSFKDTFTIVSPAAHFFMGGVKINEECKTYVNRLYAAGEVVGGVHGANRLSNNALSEAVVFGRIAGRNAAKCAIKQDAVRPTPEEEILEDIEKILSYGEGANNAEIAMGKLRDIMWEKAGIVRHKKTLEEAIKDIDDLSKSLSELKAKASDEVARVLELRNMIYVAKTNVQASLARQESRGAHFRSDYPETDDKWLSHIEISEGKVNILPVDLSVVGTQLR